MKQKGSRSKVAKILQDLRKGRGSKNQKEPRLGLSSAAFTLIALPSKLWHHQQKYESNKQMLAYTTTHTLMLN